MDYYSRFTLDVNAQNPFNFFLGYSFVKKLLLVVLLLQSCSWCCGFSIEKNVRHQRDQLQKKPPLPKCLQCASSAKSF